MRVKHFFTYHDLDAIIEIWPENISLWSNLARKTINNDKQSMGVHFSSFRIDPMSEPVMLKEHWNL